MRYAPIKKKLSSKVFDMFQMTVNPPAWKKILPFSLLVTKKKKKKK